MATVAELRAEKARLEAEEQRLRGEYDALGAEISRLINEQSPLSRELRAQRAIITDPNATQAQKDAAVQRGVEIEEQLRASDAQIRNVRDQQNNFLEQQLRPVQNRLYSPSGINDEIQRAETAEKAQADQGPGTESAGQTTQQAQAANDDSADTQSPQPGQQVLAPDGRITSPSNAVPSNAASTESAPTSGTDAETRSADQLQSTPASTAATPLQPGQINSPTGSSPAGTDRGTAADNDDNTNPVVSRINTLFGGAQAVISPTPNVLDQVASYTYNISIYLSSPEQYLSLREQGAPSLEGANLLMQSGGAPVGQRNQEFPLDFYIDNLSVTSVLQGKGTGGAHNAVELSFQVYEPLGVTFLDRLAAATRKFVKNAGQTTQTKNYAAQIYLMVIRFWGYDIDGNLVRVANNINTPGASQEPGLIVEKYIPFRFQQIKFRLSGKTATYDCRAATPRDYVAPSQTRGIIPYNIELTSVTLKELLGTDLAFGTTNQARDTEGRTGTSAQGTGNTPATQADVRRVDNATAAQGADSEIGSTQADVRRVDNAISSAQSSAPSKASAAPRPTLIRGLTAALNKFQQELVQRKDAQYPDVYKIVLAEPVLKDARIQPPEAAAGLRSVPMTPSQTAGAQKLGIKQSVNRESKNVAAVAGMSIVQFLDQVVRNSSYIFDQQTKIWEKDSAGRWKISPRGTNGSTFAWYRIGMDARPQKDKFDQIRGDYAYEITYTITPYQVNDVKSNWFPQSQFNGTHKKYEYWFTGLNTQIIDYEQNYDYLYYITINGGQGVPRSFTDYREYTQYAFQPRAPEASQGAPGPVFDPAAQAAGSLYSPGDTAMIKMTVLGDPAYIQQGEIVLGIKDYPESFYGPFLPDGTINYDSREVLFEVTFNTAGDYDTETGLMDVTRRAG